VGAAAKDGEPVMATFEAIESIFIEAEVASVTFNNNLSGFRHLWLRADTSDGTFGGDDRKQLSVRFNGDSGTNYAYTRIQGTSGGIGATTSNTVHGWDCMGPNNDIGQSFGSSWTAFFNTADSNVACAEMAYGGWGGSEANNNADDYSGRAISSNSGSWWSNTAAVTSITVYVGSTPGDNFGRSSRFTLYGMKDS
jgi:hypothetical protein